MASSPGPDEAVADSGTAAALKSKLRAMEDSDLQLKMLMITRRELHARVCVETRRCEAGSESVRAAWRDIMRLVKSEELRGELEVTSQAFERDLELRDAKIRALLGDLKQAEEQRIHVARIHATQVDELITLFKRRVEDLHKATLAEVRALHDEYAVEKAEMVTAHKATRVELLHTIRAAREAEERTRGEAEADFQQARETMRKAALEKIHALQTDMDTAIEALEKAFEDAHAKYMATTEHRTQDFKLLAARGQHDVHVKERNRKMIARLQKRLAWWQNRLALLVKQEELKLAELAGERDDINAHLLRVKQQSFAAQQRATARLTALGHAVTATRDTLNELIALARRTLGTAETVRLLEPATRRVAPFDAEDLLAAAAMPAARASVKTPAPGEARPKPAESPSTPRPASRVADINIPLSPRSAVGPQPTLEPLPLGDDGDAEPVSDLLQEYTQDAEILERFYRRMNGVVLERVALQDRQRTLAQENRELREALAGCLKAIAVLPSTTSEPNPLLVVNGATGPIKDGVGALAASRKQLTTPKGFVDASLVLAASTRQAIGSRC